MDEISAIVSDTARRLLRGLAEAAGTWEDMPESAWTAGWQAIEDSGLLLALLPDEDGGLGLPLSEGLGLVRIAGSHHGPWPVVDTMLARRFAAENGQDVAAGPAAGGPSEMAPHQRDIAALARACQMAGALEAVLEMTTAYVGERHQFGRPLARFQAIQHSLAVLAGEVAAACAAADFACQRIAAEGHDPILAIGIARARIGEAVSRGTAIAHQLHGAIGYVREHRLHRYTTAMWRWRDEFGTQAWWTRRVGMAVIAEGSDGFWSSTVAA